MTDEKALDIQNLAQEMIDVARKYATKYGPEDMFPSVKTAFYTILAALSVMQRVKENDNGDDIYKLVDELEKEFSLYLGNLEKRFNAEQQEKEDAIPAND